MAVSPRWTDRPRILLLEPWHGGSHAGLVRFLIDRVDADWNVATMPARHWKWRMRGSALWFAHRDVLRDVARPDLLVATSYVPLAELYGLIPQLAGVPSLLYFHENQWEYPVDPATNDAQAVARDFHFGMTQIVSAAAATAVAFNSEFNRRSFLEHSARHMAKMPDCVPEELLATIEGRSIVLPPPIADDVAGLPTRTGPIPERPLVVWNHRWEHDKAPDELFTGLDLAWARGARFRLSVCGSRSRRIPEAFARAEAAWRPRCEWWGPLDRGDYVATLARADVVLSTARQEFFGLSVAEGAYAGAVPLVPDRLAYRDLWPSAWRYNGVEGLADHVGRIAAGSLQSSDRVDARAIAAKFTPAALSAPWTDAIHQLASG